MAELHLSDSQCVWVFLTVGVLNVGVFVPMHIEMCMGGLGWCVAACLQMYA